MSLENFCFNQTKNKFCLLIIINYFFIRGQGRTRTGYRSRRNRQPLNGLGYRSSLRPPDLTELTLCFL